MKNHYPAWFLFLTLMFGLSGGTGAQQLHPKLKNKQVTIRKVIVLPAKVEIVRQGIKGGEGMIQESEEVSAAIAKVVAQMLREKGMEMVEAPASKTAQESDRQYALADLQNRYDALV